MAFRVGVVGHRPDRLPQDAASLDAIRARIAEVLATVAETVRDFHHGPDAAFYSREGPRLRANSPLAEGSDRMFAEEALRLGYDLCCIMPFAQAEFEADFLPPAAFGENALEHFRDILARADAVAGLSRFELDGERKHFERAYAAAGSIVLNQSDLLLVIWDGSGPNGIGGTVDTLRQAISFNVPVLWIDTKAPFGWRILRRIEEVESLGKTELRASAASWDTPIEHARLRTALSEIVSEELSVPIAVESPTEKKREGGTAGEENPKRLLEFYLAEHKPSLNLAFAWKMFRELWGHGHLHMPTLRVTDYIEQISPEWPVDEEIDPSGPSYGASWINSVLRPHFAWADKLADRYADAHRSNFIWTSLLAAGAVFIALFPFAAGFHSDHPSPLTLVTALIEFVMVVLMVGLPWFARRRRWHQRWMEYRVLAELIRELKILLPLGGGQPLPRTSTHLANYGDPARSWMYWQLRAIARETGLPDARITHGYVRDQLKHLELFVEGQIRFHDKSSERFERIHHRLHQGALYLFLVTIAGVIVNWSLPYLHGEAPSWIGRWLILISAVFPASGAALASINNQGEFARLQRRSQAMRDGFERLQDKINGLKATPPPLSLAEVTDIASQMAAMMVDENTEWRIVVVDLPHVAG